MTTIEKLTRDIETLRESVRLQRKEMADIPLSSTEHNSACAAIDMQVAELKRLLDQLDQEKARAQGT